MSSQSGTYDINSLFSEAQTRWLKPAEVLFILQNHEKYQLTHEPPQKPTSGSLYLFNKRVLRFFRRDGHNWRKKKDGRTVGEAHERLKVGNTEALNCYYAHGEHNPNFQRRSYWMLDPAYEHIVLVHYREITEGKPSPGSAAQLSPGSVAQPSPGSSSAFSPSPGSVEVTSEFVTMENGTDSMAEFAGSTSDEVNQYLRRLEEQLSLNEDSVKEIGPLYSQEESTNDSENVQQFFKQDQPANFVHEPEALAGSQFYGGFVGTQLQRNDPILLPESGVSAAYHHSYSHGYEDGRKESPSWNELLESYETSLVAEDQEKLPYSLKRELSEEKQHYRWPNFNETGVATSSSLLLQDTSILGYNSVIETAGTTSDYYSMLYDQGQLDFPVVASQQKFTIQEISPEWGYSTEATKVIIVGSFLCDPSESAWTCMFGESEVPLEIIQEGVIRCEAPAHLAGKVSLCITSSNRVSCSEIREFEYREKAVGCKKCNSSQQEATKSPEELLLLFRFVQMLLSGSFIQQGDTMETGSHLLRKLKSDDDSWGYVMESLLDGSGTSSDTVDWLLQQLLKDKLLQWLSSRCPERHNEDGCSLSKKEQGIIHMVSGLGFEWALSPILSHGVCINFRDIFGWTALHWAARFGREKMVATLLASGAYAGAVTDPNPHDPVGQTPASIAYSYGHKGLAGYLSELALTSHLSSLTLEESELSKGSAEVEAERTVDSISKGKLVASDDQVSLKDTLAAVRNAAQAAARIQSAFRVHSFRKRQQREALAAASSVDEYGLKASDIEGLSTLSKLAFGNARDHNSAALSIQKKYRGWKGRKDFLEFRQKVVKIQAHVRGYQVRKHYKVCWATGILEKVVLRWRRKGVGLRGFRNETDFIDEIEDEDILKVFRQQKVDKAIDEAVSRVLSMVDSPNARQQYHRMLQRYQLAKAELGEASNTATSVSVADVSDVDNDNMYQF